MVSFLLIISFLIHLLLIMAVLNLYQQVQRNKSQQNEELSKVLDEFLQEIKLENERLEQRLVKNNPPVTKPIYVPTEKEHVDGNKEQLTYHPGDFQRTQPSPTIEKNIDIQEERLKSVDHVETSLESQVLMLHEQGHSFEAIAKQLNRGKTEVELMIKMNQLK